jgi:hypothetical protein
MQAPDLSDPREIRQILLISPSFVTATQVYQRISTPLPIKRGASGAHETKVLTWPCTIKAGHV